MTNIMRMYANCIEPVSDHKFVLHFGVIVPHPSWVATSQAVISTGLRVKSSSTVVGNMGDWRSNSTVRLYVECGLGCTVECVVDRTVVYKRWVALH